MPKIEVSMDALWRFIGASLSTEELERILPYAKAELDGVDEDRGILKIELNDTNRPDLWSTAGLGRQLRLYRAGAAEAIPKYPFFSTKEKAADFDGRIVEVDPALREVRPYIVAFCLSGKSVDDALLTDLIQTQEKLCWNYGRKRKSIAMGVYRNDMIAYPVRYRAADPDATRFVPLGMEKELSLREICREHPKGREFGWIVSDFAKYPFLTDADGDVLSFPPVINSARIGAVETGDANLFVELTGTDIYSLTLAASIVACDAADAGHTILPVRIAYPYDTPFGREVVTPFYFQEPLDVPVPEIGRLLGDPIGAEEAADCLVRMGCPVEIKGQTIRVTVPEYRNDFLHPVDAMEDVMMGRGMESFTPVMPNDFTIGRLTRAEEFIRQVKDIMVGQGFQEMVYNYLGSRRDFVERMGSAGDRIIRISNPMTENYEYVRDSILPCLLESESVSGKAAYPHRIFEVGKVAYLEPSDVTGCVTRNKIGILVAEREAGYSGIRAVVSALFYYCAREYSVRAGNDPRFIAGRCADIMYNGTVVGVMGEVDPQVLTNWGIGIPCVACEMDLDGMLG